MEDSELTPVPGHTCVLCVYCSACVSGVLCLCVCVYGSLFLSPLCCDLQLGELDNHWLLRCDPGLSFDFWNRTKTKCHIMMNGQSEFSIPIKENVEGT